MISSVVIIFFLIDLKSKNKRKPATQDPSEGSHSSETTTSQPTLLNSQPIPSISPEVLHNPGLYLYNNIAIFSWLYVSTDHRISSIVEDIRAYK